MSLLQYPKLYFSGEISWDPSVTNNSGQIFDAAHAKLLVPAGTTLADFKKQLPMAAAINVGSWNHFGTHRAQFENVKITGVQLAAGHPVTTQDAVVGTPTILLGKLVDLDATSIAGSQLFFDRIEVGDATATLSAARSRRLHARYINFQRNLGRLPIAGNAGVAWQTVFRKEDIQVSKTGTSPALATLAAALQQPGTAGLFIRFHAYRTLYFQNGVRNSFPQQPRTSQELAALYGQNLNFSNPAYSAIVGLIGIWMVGESESVPAGRSLFPSGNEVPAGPAFIEVDKANKKMLLDFGETVPETDRNLNKAGFGPIEFVVETPAGTSTLGTLAEAHYNRASYEKTAGIIEIDLSANSDPQIFAKLAQGNIKAFVRTRGNNVTVLTESPFKAVLEDRDVYLDQGDTCTAIVRVETRGAQAPAGTPVDVYECNRNLQTQSKAGTIVTDATGIARFQIAPTPASFRSFLFLPYAANSPAPSAPPKIATVSDAYINVRTLPFDDPLAQTTPDAALTWDWIYTNILGLYDVLNPVMERTANPAINKPLSDPQRMRALVGAIKRATSKVNFESAGYMPVTRDLSNGRRILLHRWCDLILSGNAPHGAFPDFAVALQPPHDPRVAP